MSKVEFEVPDEVLDALQLTPQSLIEELRLATAIKLYKLNHLSSNAATTLTSIQHVDFLTQLNNYKTNTFNLNEKELQRETHLA